MDKEQLLSIGRPQKICMNCNAPLSVLERHPSILKTAPRNSLERLDYCPDCWQQMKDEAYESFWITHRVPKERKIRLTRKERSAALRVLFESLWDRRETEDVGPHLYFLAHLLMKWGGLKWKENLNDARGGEVVVFEDPATGDRIELAGVDIADERMTAIQGEIEEFLHQYAPEDDESTLGA
ncbi:MAG: hypothetical protein M1457_08115 [bacterium]|nr:hypothetical protein [bacterium]